MFAHTLEDQAINDATNSSLLGVPFHQQEQYDMPLLYTHNDSVLAQELEKQVIILLLFLGLNLELGIIFIWVEFVCLFVFYLFFSFSVL